MVSKGRRKAKMQFHEGRKIRFLLFRDKKMKTTSHQLSFFVLPQNRISKSPFSCNDSFLRASTFLCCLCRLTKLNSARSRKFLKGAGTGRNFHPQRFRQPRYLKSKTELCVDINVLSLKSNLCLQWNDKRMI